MIGDFNWDVSDILDPVTGDTRYLEINPNLEVYGYLWGAFTFYFRDDLWVSFTGYVQPLYAHPLDVKFWQPVEWGKDPIISYGKGFNPFVGNPFTNKDGTGQCFGVSADS